MNRKAALVLATNVDARPDPFFSFGPDNVPSASPHVIFDDPRKMVTPVLPSCRCVPDCSRRNINGNTSIWFSRDDSNSGVPKPVVPERELQFPAHWVLRYPF